MNSEDQGKVNPSPPVGDELVRDFETNLPDTSDISEETIKSHLTIKSPLINPIYYNILNTTIKLLRTVKQLIPEGKEDREIIKTLLTILNSKYGPHVINHLLEYGAYTYRELQLGLGVSKSTIHYITGRLIYAKMVQFKTVVLPYNPRQPGARPHVYVLRGAPPECAVDCIQRYYKLREPSEVIDARPIFSREAERLGREEIDRKMGLVMKVLDLLPTPCEKLSDVYACMREVGVARNDWDWVRDGVIDSRARVAEEGE